MFVRSAPSYLLPEYWYVVNRTLSKKLHRIWIETQAFAYKNVFENDFRKISPFCSVLIVLKMILDILWEALLSATKLSQTLHILKLYTKITIVRLVFILFDDLSHWRVIQLDSRFRLTSPDSKVHGANMGPTWVLSAPDGPHDDPMNLAIREDTVMHYQWPKLSVPGPKKYSIHTSHVSTYCGI